MYDGKQTKRQQSDRLKEWLASKAPTADERKSADAMRKRIDDPQELFVRRHSASGHGRHKHRDATDAAIMDRVFSGEQSSDAKFDDKKIEEQCVQEVLYYNADAICMLAHRCCDGDQVIFHMAFDDLDTGEPLRVGHGFAANSSQHDEKGRPDLTRGIHAFESTAVGVVITVKESEPDGFEITSAFPLSRMPAEMKKDPMAKITPIEYDFTEALHETEAFKAASPIDKALMDCTCSGKPVNPALKIERQRTRDQKDVFLVVSDGRFHEIRITGDDDLAATLTTAGRPGPEARELAETLAEKITEYSNDGPGGPRGPGDGPKPPE